MTTGKNKETLLMVLLFHGIFLSYNNLMGTSNGKENGFNIQTILATDLVNTNQNPCVLRFAVLNGFPFSVYEKIQNEIGLSLKQLSAILGISARTTARRKHNNRFTAIESDTLCRVARVFTYSVTVFGNIEKARAWLNQSNRGLCGEIPLNLMGTDIGSKEVEEVLHQINFGVNN